MDVRKYFQNIDKDILYKILNGKILDNKIENRQKAKEQGKEIEEDNNELLKLKEDLKLAIKEEKYEDAAKLRDEIKKIEKDDKQK